MIYIYSNDPILGDDLTHLLPPGQSEIISEEARLAGALNQQIPQAIIFDLRHEPTPIKLQERVYFEHPSIIVVNIYSYGKIESEQLSDISLTWPIEFSSIVEAINDVKKRRVAIESCGLVGRSQALAEVARVVTQVAPSDVNVLITGPSGAGKEMIARAILNKSSNPKGPFIAVNVAAMAPGIIESELFGHEKGSFTGAASRRLGVFEQATGGIIFLDEIGEIPSEVQAKLLRVLEQRIFTRVGGNTPIRADFRLIAATNRDLAGDVASGRFREDLYYRLRVIAIDLPSLSQRKSDIAPLVFHFLKARARELHILNLEIEPGAMRQFHRYDWPGNVRELKNVIDSFSITSRSGRITAVDFERYMVENSAKSQYLPVITGRSTHSAEHQLIFQAIITLTNEVVSLKQMIEREMDRIRGVEVSSAKAAFNSVNVEDAERELVMQALDKSSGNRKKAAKLLGIGERTLYRKLDKYGLR
jgi:DNA-binding NtrC family response regulator